MTTDITSSVPPNAAPAPAIDSKETQKGSDNGAAPSPPEATSEPRSTQPSDDEYKTDAFYPPYDEKWVNKWHSLLNSPYKCIKCSKEWSIYYTCRACYPDEWPVKDWSEGQWIAFSLVCLLALAGGFRFLIDLADFMKSSRAASAARQVIELEAESNRTTAAMKAAIQPLVEILQGMAQHQVEADEKLALLTRPAWERLFS